MHKTMNRQFVSLRENKANQDYLFTSIAYFIAPTIAGKKPACLISLTKNHRNLLALWEKYKHKLTEIRNIAYLEICRRENSILVLFYNPCYLAKVLQQKKHREFLRQYGYPEATEPDRYLDILQKRFKLGFPHEIGIFLGFPVADVKGFINHTGKNYLFCRYWKVYHHPQKAQNIFYSYDKARSKVLQLLTLGVKPLHILKANSLAKIA